MESGEPAGAPHALIRSRAHGADDERALVERCRAGEERAFQELIERYAPVVYTLFHRVVFDSSRAEALAQEVFLQVHAGLPYFRGEAPLSTWVVRLVAGTWMRAGGNQSPQPGPGKVGPADASLGDPLDRATAQLPANYRLLIAAHGLEGVQCEDLAEALRLPPGRVPTHLNRAKRQLRRLLEALR
jgi:RNA polymerase sigma-70 factor, ECF subfamily